jgi:hypothetical protein
MRVTIIVDDNKVVVEGIAYTIDCSALIEADVHAVQWFGDRGEIEFSTDPDTGNRLPNAMITDVSPFQFLIDAWMTEAQKPEPEPETPTAPPSVLPQDMIAQFTAADATKIRAAVEANAQFWLLWSAMTAQRDPMVVTNARFLAGWSALVQVLGADRMAAIAAALGVTVG